MVAVALFAVAAPVVAHASNANITDQSVDESCSSGTRGGGQMDANGWLYVACDRSDTGAIYYSVHILDPGGVLQRMVQLPWAASSVAPSPDGTVLYVVEWNNHTVYRMIGSRTTGYVLDTTWKLQNLPLGGVVNAGALVRGEYVATDASGNLYVVSGTWTNPENGLADYVDRWNPGRLGTSVAKTIVKYRADGTYVTNFGSVANAATDANAWSNGVAWAQWTGIAVTATGDRVFVADENNSRIHRFDRQVDGSYRATLAPFGETQATNSDRSGSCYTPGSLAAPYDLTLSPGGELLVINTSCRYGSTNDHVTGLHGAIADVPAEAIEIQRFDQNGGKLGAIFAESHVLGMVQKNGTLAGSYTKLTCPDLSQCIPWPVHGISIDRTNAIHLPQAGVLLRPAAAWNDAGADMGGGGPLGGTALPVTVGDPGAVIPGSPDTVAPIVDSLTAPQGGHDLAVMLSIAAHDDRGITGVHVYDDNVDYGWTAWSPNVQHTVSGYGSHWVSVQVRDAAGNTSGWTSIWVQVDPTPAPTSTPAPIIVPAPKPTPNTPARVNIGSGANVPTHPDPRSDFNASSPSIVSVMIPPSTTTRRIFATITATDPEGGKLYVHTASENGTWGKLHPIGKLTIPLSKGAGWKGVFVQVVDAQGNRSQVWFQPVLSAPRGASWKRGSLKADHIKGTSRADYIDLSRYDNVVDHVSCGRGIDTVLLQPEDVAAKDCEHVVRVHTPAS